MLHSRNFINNSVATARYKVSVECFKLVLFCKTSCAHIKTTLVRLELKKVIFPMDVLRTIL